MSSVSERRADPRALVDLARHQTPQDRGELYQQIANLFTAKEDANEGERALLLEIMRALSAQVDLSLRMALAERLCDHADADHDLILLLAHDRVEVASPVILRSVVLTEEDLIEIIRECSVDHKMSVARRPEIPERVSQALINTGIPDVLRGLAANVTAHMTLESLERLADTARDDKAIILSLLERRRLPQSIAIRMYGWASSALRQHILESFKIDPKLLEAQLARAVSSELTKDLHDPHSKRLQELVDKLSASGQLKAGFLLKALRENQLDLFRLAFAKLADIAPDAMARILSGPDLKAIALAARAVGIDRSAFPTMIQKLHGQVEWQDLAPEERQTIADVLKIASQDVARVRLEALLHAA